jgi:predicted ATPase/class 3 adenylate cyclase
LRSLSGGGYIATLPRVDCFDAAVLFADISGFTDLAERLGRKGQEGTEELTSILNSQFQIMLGHVAEYGGDIIKMAGDALVVAWEYSGPEEMRTSVRMAAQCAQRIQQDDTPLPEGVRLTVRIGIGVGEAHLYYVGGVDDRWEVLPLGEAFRQMGLAENHAKPGEVVVSGEAWSWLREAAIGTEIEDGFVRLGAISEYRAAQPAPKPDIDTVDRRSIEAVAPKCVRFLLSEGGENWLADMRPVTSLFIHLSAHANEAPDLDRLQVMAESIQKGVHRFEGTINCVGVDEKGLSIFAAFGVPPISHEDEPFRATRAAMAIRGAVAVTGLKMGYGIASGRTFCGTIGGSGRRDYAILGSTVNLAARLSHYSDGAILCDEATVKPASARLQFTPPEPVRLKGIANTIPVFTAIGLAAPMAGAARMVGHEKELSAVVRAIEILKAGKSSLFALEGEAGIGKSTLVQKWSKIASDAGVRVLRGGAESIHAATPYFVWRDIVGGLLGLSDGASSRERLAQFSAACRGRAWERLAPLLGDILDLELPENAITSQIAGNIRADNLRELVATLVAAAAAEGPTAIVLEDCHWMDSASLAIAAVVAQRVQPLLLLLSSRFLTGDQEHRLDALLGLPGAQRLRLGRLREEDCVALAAQRLSVRRLTPPVAALIAAKSQGNPFFSVEIASTLREHGFVIIEEDECKPVAGLDLSTVKFPDNVQGIITRRLDGLEPAVQITAKVASVIGSTFSTPLLRDSYPIESGHPRVEANLEVLESERLVVAGAAPEYTFSHALVEEAIYDRLLVAQRKALHERVAMALEYGSPPGNDALAPLLGHHWLRAGNERNAGRYFGLAGMRAVHRGAYREGLNFLSRAVDLTRPENATPDAVIRDGRWQILRAEALFGLGQLEESARAFREAARILGCPVPESQQTAQLLEEVKRRFRRGFSAAQLCPESERDRVQLLAVCYEMLSLLDLFANRMTSSLGAALESLNQAQQLGPSAEYARALSTMALATSLVPARFLAAQYARAALDVAAELGQESTSARVQEFVGMYKLGEGAWEEASDCFEKAISGFRTVGDRRREIECNCLLSTWNHYQGNFANRVLLGQRVSELATATGDLQAQAWGILDQIESLLNLSDFERVDALGHDLRRHLGQNIYGADEIMAYGLLAALELRLGRLADAMPHAEKALAVMKAVSPTIVYNLEAYAAVTEVFLDAWRLAPMDDPLRASMAARAREACAATRNFAKVFRIGRARALLLIGAERELSGDPGRAVILTRHAVATAVRLRMPYEEALARRQLARLLPEEDASRDTEIKKARDLFSRLAAKYDLLATNAMKPVEVRAP